MDNPGLVSDSSLAAGRARGKRPARSRWEGRGAIACPVRAYARSPLRGPAGRGRAGASAHGCTRRRRRGGRARKLTLVKPRAKPPAPGPPAARGGMAARLLPSRPRFAAGPFLEGEPHGPNRQLSSPAHPENTSAAHPRVSGVRRGVPCFDGFPGARSHNRAVGGKPQAWQPTGKAVGCVATAAREASRCPPGAGRAGCSAAELIARLGRVTTGVCEADVRAPELHRRGRCLGPWRSQNGPTIEGDPMQGGGAVLRGWELKAKGCRCQASRKHRYERRSR